MEEQLQCPVVDYHYSRGPDPVNSNFERLDDAQRAYGPYFRTEEAQGYWVFTDHDAIREGLQHPEIFSSRVMAPIDPNPAYKWIPVMLDPPDHTKWRQLLAEYFSPGRVKGAEARHRALAVELIESFKNNGCCDFYADFAAVFPATIFLQIMGLPIEKLPDFMGWEADILHRTEATDPDRSIGMKAMMEVVEYFGGLIAEKRENPETRGDDIVSHALDWRIDDEPPTDADLLACMLLLFMAGLDTVASQLSYSFYHLATHPEDRRKLVSDPTTAPQAVEELLRAYPIVHTARIAMQDIEFHGCPVRQGDVVAFPLGMANRDPKEHPRGGTVDFDAASPGTLASARDRTAAWAPTLLGRN